MQELSVQKRVFVLGSFAVDMVYRTGRMPGAGETVLGSGFALGAGGKGSNQAIAAARAGGTVHLLTAIGEDIFAETAHEAWRAAGVDASQVKTFRAPTGAAAILVNEETGENSIVMIPGACGELTAEDVEGSLHVLQDAGVFLTQLEVPYPVVYRGLQLARGAGISTILNPAPAPAESLRSELLRLVDVLIPNETELARLTGEAPGSDREVVAAAESLLAKGCGCVIVTLGGRGAVVCEAGRESCWIEPFHAGVVVDTTGAGDAFCGAFAVALAEGKPAGEAARFASAAAGLSVTRHGAAAGMADRAEIEAPLGSLPGGQRERQRQSDSGEKQVLLPRVDRG